METIHSDLAEEGGALFCENYIYMKVKIHTEFMQIIGGTIRCITIVYKYIFTQMWRFC